MNTRSDFLSAMFELSDLPFGNPNVINVVAHYFNWLLTLDLTPAEQYQLHSRVFAELYICNDAMAAADELVAILGTLYNRWPG